VMEVVSGDNWSCKTSQIVTTNKPTPNTFTDQMPFQSPNQQRQITEAKNTTFHRPAHPKLNWGSSNFCL